MTTAQSTAMVSDRVTRYAVDGTTIVPVRLFRYRLLVCECIHIGIRTSYVKFLD